MSPNAVYIVDKDVEFRQHLSQGLAAPHRLVQTYASPQEFREDLPDTHPCCLILGTDKDDPARLHLLEEIQQRGLRIPPIVIANQADVHDVLRAVRLGAVDVCLKPISLSLLQPLVERTLAAAARREEIFQRVQAARRQLACLTPRERELFQLVVEGKSNKEMGAALGISPRTVEHHRAHIARKLGMDRVADMVRLDVYAAAAQELHIGGGGTIGFARWSAMNAAKSEGVLSWNNPSELRATA